MRTVDTIRQLWNHAVWADTELLEAMKQTNAAPREAIDELAHVVGTHELWLARIENRRPRVDVWPEASVETIEVLSNETRTRFADYLASLTPERLSRPVTYTNSAGREFTNTVEEILVHVALHGQYHRGKVNLMLRRAGLEPAPTDFIAFVRGAPAATRTRK